MQRKSIHEPTRVQNKQFTESTSLIADLTNLYPLDTCILEVGGFPKMIDIVCTGLCCSTCSFYVE